MKEQLAFQLISVFTDNTRGYKGNIAAVIQVEEPLPVETMKRIAEELNQPAITFLWPDAEGSFHVRWFAPDAEIGLCGHGSLAAAVFLGRTKGTGKYILKYPGGKITLEAGEKGKGIIRLAGIPVKEEINVPKLLEKALGIPVKKFFPSSNKHLVLTDHEKTVKTMRPDFAKLRELDYFGYIVTAPGDEADFVSRTLVPHVKQLEDNATGSSHAVLVPYWSSRLKKDTLTAFQLSPRGGKFRCRMSANEVILEGESTVIAEGMLSMAHY